MERVRPGTCAGMSDARLATLSRVRATTPVAEAEYLATALRHGLVTTERLELAAALGDGPSRAVLGEHAPPLLETLCDLVELVEGLPREAGGRVLVALALRFEQADTEDLIVEPRRAFMAALRAWHDEGRSPRRRRALEAAFAELEAANAWRERTYDFQPRYGKATFLTCATKLALVAGRTLSEELNGRTSPDGEHGWRVRSTLFAARDLMAAERLTGVVLCELRTSEQRRRREEAEAEAEGAVRAEVLAALRAWVLETYSPRALDHDGRVHRVAYRPDRTFSAGQRLVHPTFGAGLVLSASARTMRVRFAGGSERSLAHGATTARNGAGPPAGPARASARTRARPRRSTRP